jgi:hypothetical protein
MGKGILIIGESGSGKSRSIKTLDPESTFLIKIIDKPLPFRGGESSYKMGKEKISQGNTFISRTSSQIIGLMKNISDNMLHVKSIVIDDFQYLMSYEFMDRALERGFDKFTEIGKHAFDLFNIPPTLRSDLLVYILAHNDDNGSKSTIKTIGKMLDDKIKLEGIYTIVFHTVVKDGVYKFLTKNDGYHIVKTPEDMFKETYVDNDLAMIDKAIREYF